jgi:hypothetical protein
MGWSIESAPPSTMEAVYFLILPDEFVVLYNTELSEVMPPFIYNGDMQQFIGSQVPGSPLIPLDTHTAMTLNWVDLDRMSRNRPYMNDAIKAAIALVA